MKPAEVRPDNRVNGQLWSLHCADGLASTLPTHGCCWCCWCCFFRCCFAAADGAAAAAAFFVLLLLQSCCHQSLGGCCGGMGSALAAFAETTTIVPNMPYQGAMHSARAPTVLAAGRTAPGALALRGLQINTQSRTTASSVHRHVMCVCNLCGTITTIVAGTADRVRRATGENTSLAH